MKLTYFCLLIFLILLCSSSILVTSLDSCASNLVQLQQPIPFDTKSLLCIPVWGDHNFILRYAKASSNIWSFIFSFPTNINAYGAIGFSKNGNMVGSTAIVGWMPSSGAGGMKMYSLDGKSTNEVILDKGELYIMNASSIAAAGTSLVYMIFQLKTTQPSTKLLFAIGPNGVFPNYPDYALSKHSGHISLVIDYSKEFWTNVKAEFVTIVENSTWLIGNSKHMARLLMRNLNSDVMSILPTYELTGGSLKTVMLNYPMDRNIFPMCGL
ncbi:DOMON domain protein [Medicago truncatula]|uniref:DOMON domain protein n=1 Tax=Medicago truncatula TaxID=3880 RepID=A0A072TYU9_MEDTR|nr:DOMON domain protein [Medicago truncatula]